MKSKETQNKYFNGQKAYSPFVVDLRSAASKFEKEIKKEEKIIKKEIKTRINDLKPDLKRIEGKLNDFKGDLLEKVEENNRKSDSYIKKLLSKDLVPVFKHDSDKIVKTKKSKNKQSLRGLLRAKEKSFAVALKLKIGKIASDRDISRAEQKVVWYRSILTFSLVLCLLIIPFKLLAYFDFFNISSLESKIINRSQLAMTSLMAATNSASSMDFKTADQNFKDAGANFLEAQTELNLINDSILSLASLSSDPKIKLAAESKNFLRAGVIASSLGRNLVLATDSMFGGGNNDLSVSLNNFSSYGALAVKDANDLKNALRKINVNNLPLEYQDKFNSLNKQAQVLSDNLANFVDAGTSLKEALGLTRDKRYLLVFQNNSELRASGGFIGSYALIDFRDGKIRNLEVPGGGSYDTEGGLDMRIIAPKPLWLVNPLWHFWDSNWWADWPTTAQNLEWFYEKSGGPSVDGVISITPSVIESLLEITGPIDMTREYGVVIDSNNFWEITQKIVEQKNLGKTNPEYVSGMATTSKTVSAGLPLEQDLENNPENKPKKIIGDLMVKIMEVLPQKLNKENFVNILSFLQNNLAEKQILFYFNDPVAQKAVSSRNYAGEIKESSRDYFMLVNTNIAGQKSDRKIEEKIDETSEVADDGTIINTVRIIRSHTGIKNEPLVGSRNVDWMRIYVPRGSELISADGFTAPDAEYLQKRPEADWLESPLLANEEKAAVEARSGTKIYEENGKTVFANWSMVDPGHSIEVVIKYRLPFNLFARKNNNRLLEQINKFLNPNKEDILPYSLLLQKQPGARPSDFTSRLVLPAGTDIIWRYPDNLNAVSGWELNTKIDSDKYWSILMSKK